jgi:predicted ATPase/predicted Ser/Thr protein kinase
MKLIAGRYAIENSEDDLIGRGGMGDVYRGRNTGSGQIVAIKALKPSVVAGHPDMVTRFVQEGEALRRLNHPNIVQMVAAVEEGDRHYLVMEYVSGGSLQTTLEQEKQLPLQRVVAIGLELADALTRAHHLHIIHRDIKPGNVLLAEDGTPRLTDFGVAHQDGTSNLTEAGMMVGTVDYLSPEACQGEALDGRTDIWAFGVLLFEMLTGRRPFTGASVGATVMAILTQPVPDLTLLRPDVPDALADLIYRMLEKERPQRMPSARLVGAGLEAILESVSGRFTAEQAEVATDSTAKPWSLSAKPVTRHNLPVQTAPLLGREVELEALERLLNDPAVRLVTIFGPGGMGKTRLSLAAAAAQVKTRETRALFRHGVFFVPLAPLHSAHHMVAATAEVIDFVFQAGSPERQQLLDYLRHKEMLLVLDNFEHLLEGVSLVSDIMQSAPGVKILATSRERLQLQEEQLFPVQGLETPQWETPADAASYPAVRLFVQSARRMRPEFELTTADLEGMTRICRQVQGMPLAIILAAAWVEMLTPAEIAAEMAKDLDFLETEMRDVPERQRSLRAVFDYSWNLLNRREQEILGRLSVFRGGFSRTAGQAVSGAGLRDLMALVNKSLLQRSPTGRYEVQELLRQYAAEKLVESGEEAVIRDGAAAYFAAALEKWGADLGDRRAVEAMEEMEADSENLRVAWLWGIQQKQVGWLGQMVDGLNGFYDRRGRFQDGEEACRSAAAMLAGVGTAEAKQLLLRVMGWQILFVRTVRHPDEAVQIVERARQLLADEGLAQLDTRAVRAFLLHQEAVLVMNLGRREEAKRLYEETLSLRRAIGDGWGEAGALWGVAWVSWLQGNFAEAQRLAEESVAILERLGNQREIADALTVLAGTLLSQGKVEISEQHIRRIITVRQRIGDRAGLAAALGNAGIPLLMMGRFEEACDTREESLRIFTDLGVRMNTAHSYVQVAYVSLLAGKYERARAAAEQGWRLARESEYQRGIGLSLWLKSAVALVDGKYGEGKAASDESQRILRGIGQREELAMLLALSAGIEQGLERPEGARRALAEGLQIASAIQAVMPLWTALAIGSRLLVAAGEVAMGVEVYAAVARYPYISHSPFFEWVAGRWVAEAKGQLPVEVAAAAEERGRQGEMGEMVAAVLRWLEG